MNYLMNQLHHKEHGSYVGTQMLYSDTAGGAIQEQLDDRGMTQTKKIEMVLGVPASFWNKLEAIYQEKLAKIREDDRSSM